MTTRNKIIIGFALMIVLLMGLAFVGYSGLTESTRNFREYDRLATLNVNLSDMHAAVNNSAYSLERFIRGRDVSYMDRNLAQLDVARQKAQTAKRCSKQRVISQQQAAIQGRVNAQGIRLVK